MHPANKWLIGITSSALIAGASMWEGERNVPYKDIAGVTTVCYGYIGKDIQKRRYSTEECKALLRKELIVHGTAILNCVSRPLKQHEYDAFTLFAYNVGTSGACGSRAIRLFNAGNVVGACNALAYSPSGKPVWSYINGGTTFVQGLFNRRLWERSYCLGEG